MVDVMWHPNGLLNLGLDVDPRQIFVRVATADDDAWQRRRDTQDLELQVKRDMAEYRERERSRDEVVRVGYPITIQDSVVASNAILQKLRNEGHMKAYPPRPAMPIDDDEGIDDYTEGMREDAKWWGAMVVGMLIGAAIAWVYLDLFHGRPS